jgi:8-oxo-dGTP pyrophosphatase MutT (NUDIX family)
VSGAPAAGDPELRRGGAQRIPRPPDVRPGDPPPWAGLAPEERRIAVPQVRERFAALGPARRSPREGKVDRASAVLAAIYDDAGEAHIILTRRSAALRVHSGEVSFPGGGQDDGEDLRDTARREACEEVGLDPDLVEIIGELDHLSTITSNSFIVPFVAILSERPMLRASPAEVEAVLTVPLSELLDPAIFREERWDIFGTDRPMWFFELVGDTVWGATAAMLRQLLGFATGTVARGDIGHI